MTLHSSELSALLGPGDSDVDVMKDQAKRDRMRRRGLMALAGACY